MVAKKKKNPDWGGKREGSGRKPDTLSARQLIEFEKAAKAFAKDNGKTLHDIVLSIAYAEETPVRDRLAATKLFWDKSVILASEGGEGDKVAGPAVFLPEKHPRLELVKDDGSDDKD